MLLAAQPGAGASAAPISLLRGAAVNQDGRSSALTAPNGPAQQTVIRAALDAAFISRLAVSLVQARAMTLYPRHKCVPTRHCYHPCRVNAPSQ